jgi:hypothetical protein
VFAVVFIFMPESPTHLVIKGRRELLDIIFLLSFYLLLYFFSLAHLLSLFRSFTLSFSHSFVLSLFSLNLFSLRQN